MASPDGNGKESLRKRLLALKKKEEKIKARVSLVEPHHHRSPTNSPQTNRGDSPITPGRNVVRFSEAPAIPIDVPSPKGHLLETQDLFDDVPSNCERTKQNLTPLVEETKDNVAMAPETAVKGMTSRQLKGSVPVNGMQEAHSKTHLISVKRSTSNDDLKSKESDHSGNHSPTTCEQRSEELQIPKERVAALLKSPDYDEASVIPPTQVVNKSKTGRSKRRNSRTPVSAPKTPLAAAAPDSKSRSSISSSKPKSSKKRFIDGLDLNSIIAEDSPTVEEKSKEETADKGPNEMKSDPVYFSPILAAALDWSEPLPGSAGRRSLRLRVRGKSNVTPTGKECLIDSDGDQSPASAITKITKGRKRTISKSEDAKNTKVISSPRNGQITEMFKRLKKDATSESDEFGKASPVSDSDSKSDNREELVLLQTEKEFKTPVSTSVGFPASANTPTSSPFIRRKSNKQQLASFDPIAIDPIAKGPSVGLPKTILEGEICPATLLQFTDASPTPKPSAPTAPPSASTAAPSTSTATPLAPSATPSAQSATPSAPGAISLALTVTPSAPTVTSSTPTVTLSTPTVTLSTPTVTPSEFPSKTKIAVNAEWSIVRRGITESPSVNSQIYTGNDIDIVSDDQNENPSIAHVATTHLPQSKGSVKQIKVTKLQPIPGGLTDANESATENENQGRGFTGNQSAHTKIIDQPQHPACHGKGFATITSPAEIEIKSAAPSSTSSSTRPLPLSPVLPGQETDASSTSSSPGASAATFGPNDETMILREVTLSTLNPTPAATLKESSSPGDSDNSYTLEKEFAVHSDGVAGALSQGFLTDPNPETITAGSGTFAINSKCDHPATVEQSQEVNNNCTNLEFNGRKLVCDSIATNKIEKLHYAFDVVFIAVGNRLVLYRKESQDILPIIPERTAEGSIVKDFIVVESPFAEQEIYILSSTLNLDLGCRLSLWCVSLNRVMEAKELPLNCEDDKDANGRTEKVLMVAGEDADVFVGSNRSDGSASLIKVYLTDTERRPLSLEIDPLRRFRSIRLTALNAVDNTSLCLVTLFRATTDQDDILRFAQLWDGSSGTALMRCPHPLGLRNDEELFSSSVEDSEALMVKQHFDDGVLFYFFGPRKQNNCGFAPKVVAQNPESGVSVPVLSFQSNGKTFDGKTFGDSWFCNDSIIGAVTDQLTMRLWNAENGAIVADLKSRDASSDVPVTAVTDTDNNLILVSNCNRSMFVNFWSYSPDYV